MKARCLPIIYIIPLCNLISIYIPHTSLYITVMVTLYSHKLLYQSALFCSEMSYSDVQKCTWFELNNSTCIFLFDHLFAKAKMKQCLLGISRLNRVDRLRGCWKLEIGSWKLEIDCDSPCVA